MKKTILILGLFILVGCAETADITEAKPITEMYKEAYDQLNDKNYADAATTFSEIESNYPTDEMAPTALEMAAYAQFETGDFAGTLSTIDRFMRFHPGHKDVPYIMYLKGMCFYKQVSDVRREPGMSNYALNAFNQLTERFPESEYAKNAANKIIILKNYIAGKIMYGVRRDLKRQNYPVAITNLQKIILSFQDTEMTPEAMFRLTEAYNAIGLKEQAVGYSAMLKKNFPESIWAKKLKS